MAHGKSERFSKLITQTPADIGPGTYDISDVPQPSRNPHLNYPFLIGSKRVTLAVPKDAERIPAPNVYTVKEPQKHIPERVSIDFTDVRFKRKIYEGPGPAEYDLPEDTMKEVPRKIRSHPGTWRGPAGKLWLKRPPSPFLLSGVSVPSKFDVNGYDFDEYGALVKNSTMKCEPTFFYNVPREVRDIYYYL